MLLETDRAEYVVCKKPETPQERGSNPSEQTTIHETQKLLVNISFCGFLLVAEVLNTTRSPWGYIPDRQIIDN